ncbi:hypothetical protein NL676_036784 [Syzygium grande]|nr:hypothetical protein NL676_036784 [Syzygium grande]
MLAAGGAYVIPAAPLATVSLSAGGHYPEASRRGCSLGFGGSPVVPANGTDARAWERAREGDRRDGREREEEEEEEEKSALWRRRSDGGGHTVKATSVGAGDGPRFGIR